MTADARGVRLACRRRPAARRRRPRLPRRPRPRGRPRRGQRGRQRPGRQRPPDLRQRRRGPDGRLRFAGGDALGDTRDARPVRAHRRGRRPFDPADLPGRRVLQGEAPSPSSSGSASSTASSAGRMLQAGPPVLRDGSLVAVNTFHDVTPRIEEERRVRERERRLRELADQRRKAEDRLESVLRHMPVGVILIDASDGRLLFANDAARAPPPHPVPDRRAARVPRLPGLPGGRHASSGRRTGRCAGRCAASRSGTTILTIENADGPAAFVQHQRGPDARPVAAASTSSSRRSPTSPSGSRPSSASSSSPGPARSSPRPSTTSRPSRRVADLDGPDVRRLVRRPARDEEGVSAPDRGRPPRPGPDRARARGLERLSARPGRADRRRGDPPRRSRRVPAGHHRPSRSMPPPATTAIASCCGPIQLRSVDLGPADRRRAGSPAS